MENKQMKKTPTIVVGVSGGIAVYQTAELVDQLIKDGYQVQVVMTKSAQEFVQPLTFATLSHNEVYHQLFDQNLKFDKNHVSIAKSADCVVLAPATANLIAKMAHGIADDLLTTTLLALNPDTPVLICPSMVPAMYHHPLTQENLKKLAQLNYHIIGPQTLVLKNGEKVVGAMSEITDIEQNIKQYLQ